MFCLNAPVVGFYKRLFLPCNLLLWFLLHRPLWPRSDNAPRRALISSSCACCFCSTRTETLGAVTFSLVTCFTPWQWWKFCTNCVKSEKICPKSSFIPVICGELRTSLPFSLAQSPWTTLSLVHMLYIVSYCTFWYPVFHMETCLGLQMFFPR